ncbi:MAG: hypothetical protein BMS9Abin18_0367 [Zetaproteobacteria bacterium]|nr:MAG: hypothetical protein BMS9Abin18_0367 [Zetaproteobacteria bacterium]
MALFPQKMWRLVWFVPETRLAEGLEFLADTGAFHPVRECRLGSAQDISSLKQAVVAKRRQERQRVYLHMLARLPKHTLLQYALGEGADISALPANALKGEDNVFLWAGSEAPPEEISTHLYSTGQEPMPPLPLTLSDQQWQLLFDTAASIGHAQSWAVIDGWAPASEVERFRSQLQHEAACLVPAEQSGLAMDDVPVKFARHAALDGFGALMQMFAVTGYRELDPAPLLAFGFVLMFGMMFGDLGHGMVLFLAGVCLHAWSRRAGKDAWRRFAQVLIPVGLSAAFFGTLFGSFFSHEDLLPALWFHPMQHTLIYIALSILMGMATIALGLVLGLFNAWRMGRWSSITWEHFGPLGLAFYLGLIGVGIGSVYPHALLFRLGAGFCIASMLALAVHYLYITQGENIFMRLFMLLLELYEFALKFTVQTISFVRVAAFMIAHLALSSVLVLLSESLSFAPWLAWSAFVMGNGLIIVVEGALVAIQALRLHFFEFFTKFVVGKGQLFQPLNMRKEWV